MTSWPRSAPPPPGQVATELSRAAAPVRYALTLVDQLLAGSRRCP
jgi:hypothetical protein